MDAGCVQVRGRGTVWSETGEDGKALAWARAQAYLLAKEAPFFIRILHLPSPARALPPVGLAGLSRSISSAARVRLPGGIFWFSVRAQPGRAAARKAAAAASPKRASRLGSSGRNATSAQGLSPRRVRVTPARTDLRTSPGLIPKRGRSGRVEIIGKSELV